MAQDKEKSDNDTNGVKIIQEFTPRRVGKFASYQGYYKKNFLRSYKELLFALSLEYIEKKQFITEGIALVDEKGNKKIPDFVVYDEKGIYELVEIKSSENDSINLICEYAWRKLNVPGVNQRFVHLDYTNIRGLENNLRLKMGSEQFDEVTAKFKNDSQHTKIYAFPGEMNGMWGRKHSEETLAKMRKAHSGQTPEQNPMYGKTHSAEARAKISERSKWKDPDYKFGMQKKGMIKHFSSFISPEKEIFNKYLQDVVSGNNCKKPLFLNGAYSLREEKIIQLFGSVNAFISEMKDLGYAFTT